MGYLSVVWLHVQTFGPLLWMLALALLLKFMNSHPTFFTRLHLFNLHLELLLKKKILFYLHLKQLFMKYKMYMLIKCIAFCTSLCCIDVNY